jgi:hypothetical protein
MPQSSIKNYFLIVSNYLSYKIGPIDLVRGLFSSLDIRTYILPTCGPLCIMYVLGHQGTPKWTQKSTQRPTNGPDLWPKVKASKWAPYQIIRPILVREIVRNNQKNLFPCCFGVFELPQMDPKRYTKACKLTECMSQHLSLRTSP